jgi:hypothetical protein
MMMTKIRRPHAGLIASTLLVALCAAGVAHAATDPDRAPLDIRSGTQHGIAWRTGGIGRDAVQAMRAHEGRYDLHVVLSEGRHKAYVADARLRVTDAKGKPVLRLAHAGPLVDAKLPAGDYTVQAAFGAMKTAQKVHVETGKPADAYLHFAHDKALS